MRKAAFIIFAAVAILWLFAANPFNWFVSRSERFSMEKFQAIRPGTRIEDAVEQLGKPIRIDRSEYNLGCPGCSAYYFLGDPPPWLISFKEAWLLVEDGKVVTVTVNSEP